MRYPRLLDKDHVLIKICGCSEQSLTLDECRSRRDHLNHAIQLLEFNQEPRVADSAFYGYMMPGTGFSRMGPSTREPECEINYGADISTLARMIEEGKLTSNTS